MPKKTSTCLRPEILLTVTGKCPIHTEPVQNDIALIGGMGTGKTTLAKALCQQVPDMNYVYMSKYNVRIPMTLNATTRPDLLCLTKPDFIKEVFSNENVEWRNFPRYMMDEFLERVYERYGDTILAEIGIAACIKNGPNVLDNVVGAGNVKYLKEKKHFIVGLHCSINTQVERMIKVRRDIDPEDDRLIRQQVLSNNIYRQVNESLKLADVCYDTDEYESDSPEIVYEIINAIQ